MKCIIGSREIIMNYIRNIIQIAWMVFVEKKCFPVLKVFFSGIAF
jgi:hypothetical protein